MAKLARIENGTIQNVIVGDPSDFPNLTDVTGTPYSIGWTDNGDGTFSQPPAPPKAWDDIGSFLREFTESEIQGIRSAAESDAKIDHLLFMLDKFPRIVANDTLVTNGMQHLVDQGHLMATRRDEILGSS